MPDGSRWTEMDMENICPLIREWRIEEIWLGKELINIQAKMTIVISSEKFIISSFRI